MSELLALRKAAAKRQAKKRARKSNDAEGLNLQEPAAAAVKAKSKSKLTGKGKGKSKTVAGPTRRLAASQLKWKPVNTSTVSAMDGGGGMLMLEELEGVGVEWVEEGGGRRATFVTSRPEDEDEEEEEGEGAEAEEWHGIKEDGDTEEGENEDEDEEADEASDSDLPNFAGLDADDFADGEVEEEPSFDDGLLPAWSGVPIHTALKQAMVRLGFVAPTDIQQRAVPSALEGHDIVGVAETGSGKTLAYSLPVLSHLLRQPLPKAGVRRPLSALVLCPTRELALQVTEHLSKVLKAAFPEEAESKKPPRVSVAAVVGGLSQHKQTRVLSRGADIIVATPGRLWDILKADETFAAGVRGMRFLIIDEADRMIETGHFAELEHIVQLTQRSDRVEENDATFAAASTALTRAEAREDLQTFVFSATLSKDLQANLKKRNRTRRKGRSTMEDLVDRLDFRDSAPTVVDLTPEGGLVASLREAQVSCVVSDKDLYLYYFLLRYPGRTLVFTSSIDGIRRLIPLFETLKVPVYPLHSQLQQKQRLRNLDRFKSNPHAVLIATDVAARGLDIPSVDHVVHFNLPRTADAYVHRSGRTARAQNPGFALQIVSPEDRNVQRGLLKALKRDELPAEMEIEAGFLRQLRERINLARDIEKAQHAVKKEVHDRNWLKEAAEAMDVDIDPSLLSDDDADPDAPTSQKKGNRRSNKAANLKGQLAQLLSQPLVARGVSTRYPTSGTRVIVDDVLSGSGHNVMLGAGTKRAFEEADEGVHKARKVIVKPKRETKSAQERKQEKRDERKRKRDGPRRRKDDDEDDEE